MEKAAKDLAALLAWTGTGPEADDGAMGDLRHLERKKRNLRKMMKRYS